MKLPRFPLFFLLAITGFAAHGAAPEALPGTAPLPSATGDERSKEMVAGIDRFAMKQIEVAAKERRERWSVALGDLSKRDAYIQSMRQKLRTCLGMVDQRVPSPSLEAVTEDPINHAPLALKDQLQTTWVRWPVFPGVYGEGILIKPPQPVHPSAIVICLPDASKKPGTTTGAPTTTIASVQQAGELAAHGCTVVVPLLLNHDTASSGRARYNVATNATHREWIYHQSFTQGRTVAGYELAEILSLVDALGASKTSGATTGGAMAPTPVIGIMGHGEGGLLALKAAALDDRLHAAWISGCFGHREHLWEEPLDRNAYGFINDFGSAELGAMVLPRTLFVSTHDLAIEWAAPALGKGQRPIAAPRKISTATNEEIAAEAARVWNLLPTEAQHLRLLTGAETGANSNPSSLFLNALGVDAAASKDAKPEIQDWKSLEKSLDAPKRQEELVRQLQDFAQSLIAVEEHQRETGFWDKLPLTPLDAYTQHTAPEREHFWNDVIGKFSDPTIPLNPRSRLISENEVFTVHEVMLDVWPDVVAWGYVLIPKDIKPGERRPVVVCQHGLEGLPEDTVTEDPKNGAFHFYKGFASALARQGFITFAPHNFYRGKDAFRVVQRKLNLTGHSLFSVIIPQHQRILEWLKAQPNVDASRIAFYGLSYGGKSAMRIPAALPDYCLSICSGDFNEWVRKCVSVDMRMSYVFAPEYEIWEWNLGGTFNYGEMAALIAPRPFMVERGHNDGVGIDEWVSYEFAKVRRLYDKLGIGDRTQIEYFEGPHTIHAQGTFEFLHKQLGWPGK